MAALKHSRQREAIKEFLMTQTTHPTADIIYDNIKQIYPNISLGTVYRNLSLLTELGEIRKLSCFGGADHYDGRTEPHFHFLCTECGSIIDLELENADNLLVKADENFSGRITGYSARFFGLCEDCMNKAKKTENTLDREKIIC